VGPVRVDIPSQTAIDARHVSWFSLEALGALIRRYRADDSAARAIRRIMRADVIIIDDIGVLPVTTETAEALYRVVDAAYEPAPSPCPRTSTRQGSTSSCPKPSPTPPSTASCTTPTSWSPKERKADLCDFPASECSGGGDLQPPREAGSSDATRPCPVGCV
jgi:hypothetical protein